MIVDMEDVDDLKRYVFYDFLSVDSGVFLTPEQLEETSDSKSEHQDALPTEGRKDLRCLFISSKF